MSTGRSARLYAPGSWQSGSSFSHLDENAYPAGDADALMTPQLSPGEVVRDPGPIVRQVFQDMGWAGATAPPTWPATPGRDLYGVLASTGSSGSVEVHGLSASSGYRASSSTPPRRWAPSTPPTGASPSPRTPAAAVPT